MVGITSVPDVICVPLTATDWNEGGNKDKLREVYKDFHPTIDTILSYVDGNDLKLWELLDMETLPTWVNDRLVLLGDAAHPFLPRECLSFPRIRAL